MADNRVCDVCEQAKPGVVRYGLQHRTRTSGGVTSSGNGSIDMCSDCHDRIAKPRMRAKA